jgi:hypothetical protein
MTTKKKAAGKGHVKKLKVKKETLRDLDPKGSRKVKAGAMDTAISRCECTQNLCRTGNIFCNPMTAPWCQTLNCAPTLWSCNKG